MPYALHRQRDIYRPPPLIPLAPPAPPTPAAYRPGLRRPPLQRGADAGAPLGHIQALVEAEADACVRIVGTIFSPTTVIDIRAETLGEWFRADYIAAVVPLLRRVQPIERPGLIERMNLCVTELADSMVRARTQSFTVWSWFHRVLRQSLADAAFYAAYQV